ncbi:hypothetical protein FJY70_00265 [candidate division WOR-3 bacterium]|nr:hypothetical protein [candidate division WOR-3 bacterium]
MTPWGRSQTQEKLADGFYWVSTAGHGGFLIGRTKAADYLTSEGRKRGMEWGSWLAYEEDCQWAIVGYEQATLTARTRPDSDPVAELQAAFECLTRWNPDYLIERGIVPDLSILRADVEHWRGVESKFERGYWAVNMTAAETRLAQAEKLAAELTPADAGKE